MAVLADAPSVSFRFLEDVMQISDSDLARPAPQSLCAAMVAMATIAAHEGRRARTSPCSRANQPSGSAAQARQPADISSRSPRSAIPRSTACSATRERVIRSAQAPPYQARSSGVA